jgi:hypothetical protein
MDTALLIEKSILVLLLFLVSLGAAAYMTYFERKLAAWIQDRVGPDRAGPFGILQPIADGVKMFLKEDFIPAKADKWLFIIGPGIAMFTALITSAVVPWGPKLHLFGRDIALQVADINSMEDWVVEKVQQLRSVTDRPIVVRPHPRSPLQLPNLPKNVTIQSPKPVVGTYDDFDMHYNCHAVVNHNSGPGIQAAIGGVRPIVDDSSLACPVSVSMLDLEKPYVLDREQWLIEICHTEYTLEEMRQGCFIDRLCAAL